MSIACLGLYFIQKQYIPLKSQDKLQFWWFEKAIDPGVKEVRDAKCLTNLCQLFCIFNN